MPGTQGIHDVEAPVEYVPVGHIAHLVEPAKADQVPLAQGQQLLCPIAA